jgi:hypothetical protein
VNFEENLLSIDLVLYHYFLTDACLSATSGDWVQGQIGTVLEEALSVLHTDVSLDDGTWDYDDGHV